MPHHRAQAAAGRVVMEQRLGKLRLHAEHVDQKAQGAQVVGQAVESAGLHGTLRVDLGLRQGLDLVTHVQHGHRGVVHAQHRKHTAHGRQLARHRDQQRALGGLAEILVDLFFNLGQRRTQLLHHAAHGLAVRDTPVQLFHPDLQRLRVVTGAHIVDALGQVLHPFGQGRVVQVAVFDRGIQVEHAGGHFHGQRCVGRAVVVHGLGHGVLQGPVELFTGGQQTLQGFTDQGELPLQAIQAVHLAPGDGGPVVFGAADALPGHGQQRRIEAAQARGLVVGGFGHVQPPGPAHGGQARRHTRCSRYLGVAAEKQQVLNQTVRQPVFTAFTQAQLGQQARSQAFAVDITVKQAHGLGLEHRSGDLPEGGDVRQGLARGACSGLLPACAGTQVGAQVAHVGQGAAVGRTHQRQHQEFHRVARGVVSGPRGGRGVNGQVVPAWVSLRQGW